MKSSNENIVTQQDILEGLHTLGLKAGMGVMVHSSLKSFGYVEGGALTVIMALIDSITPEGTILMPSFNHGIVFSRGKKGFYDPLTTPTINGIIPDTFWRMPGVKRSLDPTHPIAAWGKHAQRYTQFHHRTLTMGPESPLGLLWKDGGVCVLFGVKYEANTFHHVVEMTTGAPCLGLRTEAYPVQLPDGRRVLGRTWGWRKGTCPYTDKGVYFAEMEHQGLLKKTKIGDCQVILYSLEDCFQTLAPMLKNGKNGIPPCTSCPIRPRQVRQTVASDWDVERQVLLPDSLAWTY